MLLSDHILHLPCVPIGSCKDWLLEQGVSQHVLLENQTEGQKKMTELDLAGKQKAEFDQFNKENQQAEGLSTTITSVNMEFDVNTIEASNAITEISNIDKEKPGPTELPFLELRCEKER